MTDAMGPVYGAGFQYVSKSGYKLCYLPDVNNDELQREGKPPVYHWFPNEIRLAKRENGDFKFSFVHFVGVRSEDTNVGVQGTEEVAGGLVGFSTTSAPPDDVLREAHNELTNRFRGSDDHFWGWRSNATPMIRPGPIMSSVMAMTNLAVNRDGTMPAIVSAGSGNRAPVVQAVTRMPAPPASRSITVREAMRGSNLDSWYVNLQGQGPGSVSPFAENTFSGLVGSIPAALIWASFHGANSPICVQQFMKVKVWSPIIQLSMHGSWEKVQSHFSAAAHAGGLFWSADIKAEVNNLRASGDLEVDLKVDATFPGADKLQQELDKRADLISQKFLELAQKFIFDPAPFKEEAAQASGGIFGIGGGGAFKLRRDTVNLDLTYNERRQMAYLQDYKVDGQLEALYDVIKNDPAAEKKYFMTLYMGDWDRKVSRIFKPVVNWPDPAQKWVGQPVSFLSVQVGYPDTNGTLQWNGHMFQAKDGADATWQMATEMKKKEDVSNPPAGWEPDKTFIKRQIHFTEPPNETEYPFVRVSVEKNVVDLDPGDAGVPLNDRNLEIRVDNVGSINCGPIMLNADLENEKQIVEVTFQADGKTLDGHPRAPVKFQWKFGDQVEPRYWMVFTGDPDFLPKFKYQVHVLVKGSIFTKGKEWIGPWQDASGNGPIMLSVPTPEDEGVTMRELVIPMVGAEQPAAVAAPPATGAGRPPPSRKPAKAPAVRAPSRAPAEISGWSVTPPSTDASGRGVPPEKAAAPYAASRRLRAPAPPPAAADEGWTTVDPRERMNGPEQPGADD